MVYADDEEIMIDGITLPGLIKNFEISAAAEIEEQEVQGSTAKPKQATGYEDGKINLELVLIDSSGMTKEEKLQIIQNLFREKGQEIPAVHSIVNGRAAKHGITQVLIKSMNDKVSRGKEQIEVTIELWEYIPMTISIMSAKEAGETNYAAPSLDADYQSYLQNRGAAPKQDNKTGYSPVRHRGLQE